ncbi:hypothetical protein [Corynebacterium propinquum]
MAHRPPLDSPNLPEWLTIPMTSYTNALTKNVNGSYKNELAPYPNVGKRC